MILDPKKAMLVRAAVGASAGGLAGALGEREGRMRRMTMGAIAGGAAGAYGFNPRKPGAGIPRNMTARASRVSRTAAKAASFDERLFQAQGAAFSPGMPTGSVGSGRMIGVPVRSKLQNAESKFRLGIPTGKAGGGRMMGVPVKSGASADPIDQALGGLRSAQKLGGAYYPSPTSYPNGARSLLPGGSR